MHLAVVLGTTTESEKKVLLMARFPLSNTSFPSFELDCGSAF